VRPFWRRRQPLLPAAPAVEAQARTDPGCCREINEDCAQVVYPPKGGEGLLLLVADGVGGHAAGEVASRMAVEIIGRAFYRGRAGARERLTRAFQRANRAIHRAARQDSHRSGMGTTCVALALQNGLAFCAHAGDSRLYLLREGALYQMTEDHSAVMEMVRRGLILPEEARRHPDKNVILRALGTRPQVEVSAWPEPFPVRPGDRFLLCSDGLHDLVEDTEIRQILLEEAPEPACERLIALARDRGGYDNVTVGIVAVAPETVTETALLITTREMEIAR